MELQIRQQLTDLTKQNGLDKSFVDRILLAMEKPVAIYSDTPVAENETLLSTASVMEKGILTVAAQIKDTAKSLLGEKGYIELRADRELFYKINSLKDEHDRLMSCLWSTVRARLEEEGIALENDTLGIRNDFQIVSIPEEEIGLSPLSIDVLTALGGGGILIQASGPVDRSDIPLEILEACPCPECQAELARRKESAK